MAELTLQIKLNFTWHDAAILKIEQDKMSLRYLESYALEHFGCDDNRALSVNLPVTVFPYHTPTKKPFRFIDDIILSGAGKRFWMANGLPKDSSSYNLLHQFACGPIGNIRVKEANASTCAAPLLCETSFTVDDVVNKGWDFLDYAKKLGIDVRSATGAGGEAPKFLLSKQGKQICLRTPGEDIEPNSVHYLVKFPRGKQSAIDSDILRAEFHYYRELEALGFNTIATNGMMLLEGPKCPSLWLPRFDVLAADDGGVTQLAVESVYSVLEKPPGSLLDHEETLRTLIQTIQSSFMVQEQGYQFDVESFVIEWVKRDLLNIIFGNSDNHGRNISMMRSQGKIMLAPIYDFAPMKADPQGVVRTITWASSIEIGGLLNFMKIAETLDDLVSAERLLNEVGSLAQSLLSLRARLEKRGVPASILNYPSIGLNFISKKLQGFN
ncbi:type II toxin-antitoxin system HipA family toxin [Shewanella spartinae]|uniref:type II toxin-antitoxin system HipA family toxin n=1 Tax=Shewanella spartinae TaxID=2864205 RepID=UPI001C660E61|nr:HipA domain-containing protein [Shewanella spartinae]QYJ95700.1 HipA domain-containing protein [Shewanella spartinae]